MVIIGPHGYNLRSISAKLRGTNCSVPGCDSMTLLQCENSALPFPLFSKVQVSVVPRCSGGLAQPAPPTQCQPVSALLSSKKILRVTLTEAAATRNHRNNNNTHTSHVVRDVVSPSSAGDSILVTPLHTPPSSPAPFFVAACCSDSHQAGGAGLGWWRAQQR